MRHDEDEWRRHMLALWFKLAPAMSSDGTPAGIARAIEVAWDEQRREAAQARLEVKALHALINGRHGAQ